MTEKEFVNNATKLLTKDFSIPKEEAEAIAKLTVILEKNNKTSPKNYGCKLFL